MKRTTFAILFFVTAILAILLTGLLTLGVMAYDFCLGIVGALTVIFFVLSYVFLIAFIRRTNKEQPEK